MKKFFSFIILTVLALSMNVSSFAQVTIPAGNTLSNSVRQPLGSWYGYERTALIYTAAEVTQFGSISKVAFYVESVSSPAASTPVQIYMKSTPSLTMTASTFATYTAGATLVYSGNILAADLVPGTWVTITLDLPFAYASDNLMVLVETNATGGGNEGSAGKRFRRFTVGDNKFQSWNTDTNPPTGNGTLSTSRTNIQLTFAPSAPCDMSINNLNPTGTIVPGCSQTYFPKVKISNAGTNPQTGISVNYSVGAYTSTVTGLSLGTGENMDVTFTDPLTYTSADAGVKNVTVTVNSTCSGAQVYTLNTSFTVSGDNPNFGGPVFGYYFANSTSGASCAPDQPIYFWEDTTGSTTLIADTVNVASSLLVGSKDDGFYTLGGILGGDVFRYAGVDYDSFFVGTNGMIAFSRTNNTQAQLTTFTPLAIPSASAPRPAMFPFWKDMNFGDVDVIGSRLSYKVVPGKLIITYDRAPIYNTAVSPEDYVSFQVILETSPAPIADGLIITQFDEAAAGSVFLANYNSGALTVHTVGIQNLAGDAAIQYRRANPVTGGPLYGSNMALSFGTDNNALPVELASFTSSVNGRNVELNWATASELNNSGFDIERSVNGNWTKVANVSGNGTTTSPQSYSYTDRNVASGNYSYRLKQIDFNGNFEYFNLSSEVNVGVPSNFALSQNYPNPFNPSTKINYDLPTDSKVSIKLFDMSGREVMTLVNEVKTAGYYTVSFNGANLSSGVYFYTISADNFVSTKKMTLIK